MFRNTTSWAVVGMIGWMGLVGTARLSAQDETRLADAYAAWVREVDGEVGGDWSALLNDAKELDESFRERLATLDKEVVAFVRTANGGVQRAGNRLLRKEDVVLAVESLGDTSVRLQVALAWVDYSLMCERFTRSRAQAESAQRNWKEACRVFADYQSQVVARQNAMHELWRLHTGRGRVMVAIGGTGSLERAATPQEALLFAMQRAQFAMSPIRVEPPRWTRVKELWSRERLIELTKKQPQLTRLQGMVQTELRTLQLVHLEHVQQLSEKGRPEERLMALGSLGWWTDHRGVKMIRDGLQLEPEDPRHNAALSALERLQLSAKDLAPYAKHQQPTVRLAVARLLRHRVGEGAEGLPILQSLSVDSESSVRRAAFDAAENLFNLGYGTTVFQIRWGVRAIKSTDHDTVLDAIQFLSTRTQGLDPASRVALVQALTPSTRSSDPRIRDAALTAMPR